MKKRGLARFASFNFNKSSGFTAVSLVFAAMLLMLPLFGQTLDIATPDTAIGNEIKVDPNNPQLDSSGGIDMGTFLINSFEQADLWYGSMWVDDGIIRVTKRQGSPASVREADADNALYVLGVKINFYKRSFASAAVEPPQPVRIPGITKSISIWVNGKNRNHTLYAVVKDMKGSPYRVRLGSMNFAGWKKLSGPVSTQILQDSPTHATPYRKRGLEFVSLLIEFDVQESLGVFFTYFDNLEAETNLYHEKIDIAQAKLTSAERSEPLDDW